MMTLTRKMNIREYSARSHRNLHCGPEYKEVEEVVNQGPREADFLDGET